MSLTVTEVAGNPNPKAVTFEIDADLMGSYAKLMITRTGNIQKYAPIAQMLFTSGTNGSGGDLSRIDLTHHEGKTRISLTRSLMTWESAEKQVVKERIQKFLNSGKTILYLEAISQNIVAKTAYSPNTPLKQFIHDVFNGEVVPSLAEHGGNMEILDIQIKQNGEIQADAALVGSCNGCESARSQTISAAIKVISTILDEVKADRTDLGWDQNTFKDIIPVPVNELAFKR